MAVDLAAVARVDDRAKVLSPTSRGAAHANLLCAEEAAHANDAQPWGADYNALKRAKELQQQVAPIRLRQAQAVEAQRLVDLELAQATAACQAASDDAVRIAEARAVRRTTHVDEVRLRRDVVARMPAVSSDVVTSSDNGGAAGTASRRGRGRVGCRCEGDYAYSCSSAGIRRALGASPPLLPLIGSDRGRSVRGRSVWG